MAFGGWQLVLAFASVALSIYYYFLKKLNYWKDKGVPSPTPRESLASSVDFLLMRTSIHERLINNYKKWRKYAFYGVSPESQPALVVNDLDLIRCVLIKDFQVFCGRGIHFDEKMDPLDAHLFNIDGSRWKALRTKLTPVFTSGKLKHMFDLLLECANHYEKYIHNQVKLGKDIEFREASAKFTTDVIGSCAFGLEMNALSQEDSEFRDAGRRIFEHGRWRAMKRILVALAPRLFRFLNVRINDKDISDFFIASVKETIAYRQRENIVRHDLIDTLIDIQKKHDNKEFELTIEVMAAQAFVFFLAGFETSSTTISFALYELAYSPDVQEKLINEIRDALKQNKGQLTYALVNEMKYLEMVIDETLRKNPPVPFLQRLAHQPWTIPNTNITIEPGTEVVIPAYCIHHDPEYYPEPELFDPERFSEENKHTRHPMAYLPFGDGPKNCIGARFAAYQVKLGLIKILQNYRVKPTKLSPYPYKIDRTSVITKPEGGVHLKLEPLK